MKLQQKMKFELAYADAEQSLAYELLCCCDRCKTPFQMVCLDHKDTIVHCVECNHDKVHVISKKLV